MVVPVSMGLEDDCCSDQNRKKYNNINLLLLLLNICTFYSVYYTYLTSNLLVDRLQMHAYMYV